MQGFLSSNGAWVLNLGVGGPTKEYATWAKENPDRSIIMTEGIGFNRHPPPQSFVMFRNPQTHIVSQYFHCTESNDHKKPRRMPGSLLEWLQYWESVRQNATLQKQKSKQPWKNHWADERYSCYNPINLQSWLTGSYGESKEQLKSRFDGIGILSEFHLSGCVFLTINLKRVHGTCNCTGLAQVDMFAQNQSFTQQSTIMAATATAVSSSSLITSGINAKTTNTATRSDGTHKAHDGHDHGVEHHGDSYQPSDEEMQLILNLTRYDQMLYDTAEEIFQAQVTDLEQKYQVTFCKSPPPSAVTSSSSSNSNQKRQMMRRTQMMMKPQMQAASSRTSQSPLSPLPDFSTPADADSSWNDLPNDEDLLPAAVAGQNFLQTEEQQHSSTRHDDLSLDDARSQKNDLSIDLMDLLEEDDDDNDDIKGDDDEDSTPQQQQIGPFLSRWTTTDTTGSRGR
jgi:hypothetical protein